MKNLFKKIGVFTIALFTLVSCNTSRNNVSFVYDSLNQIKDALANAEFYDDEAKTGVYLFEENKDSELSVHPTETIYKVYSEVKKEDKNTMTKDQLTLKKDNFVVETILRFKHEDGSTAEYYLNVRETFDEDLMEQALKDGKLGVLKSTNEIYEGLKYTYSISIIEKVGEDKHNLQRLMYVCSNTNAEATEQFALSILGNIKYAPVGK